ncbi:Uncharacterised protein [Klebsiella pneumoniae]|nr:Uncharacterised protein [Klebsiella pneumoniae]
MLNRIALEHPLRHFRVDFVAVAVTQAKQLHIGTVRHTPATTDHQAVAIHRHQNNLVQVLINRVQVDRGTRFPRQQAVPLRRTRLHTNRCIAGTVIAHKRFILTNSDGGQNILQDQLLNVKTGATNQLVRHRDQGDHGFGTQFYVVEF